MKKLAKLHTTADIATDITLPKERGYEYEKE